MWILYLVLINPAPGFDKAHALETYRTYEGCFTEQLRLTLEMEKAYPGDTDYYLTCKLRNGV